MPLDETEAYLRHRARVHEREKRDRLRRKGKLEAYLAEIERNKPKIEHTKEEEIIEKEAEDVSIDKIMEEYYAIRNIDKENSVHSNQIRIDNAPEEDIAQNMQRWKKVKRSGRKKKIVIVEEEEQSVILDEAEFKPQMAGSTGLPTFFFNNVVENNSKIFARCRLTCRPKKKITADQSL